MKKMKGFTLLELIIVMAILSILMTAVIRMFKPIRETYVDATMVEAQRTAQNGIVQYISESVRFSTDLGIYNYSGSGSVTKAVEDFASVYLPANGVQLTDSNYASNVTELKKYAEVIIIDNGEYNFNHRTDYTGRLLRRKVKKDASGNVLPMTTNAEIAGTDECRIALGGAYYGDSSYSIKLWDPDTANAGWTADEGIKITVKSQIENHMRSYTDGAGNKQYATTSPTNTGLVVCRNQCSPINGIFDTTKYTEGNALVPDSKVYIVFLNNKIDIVP